MGGKGIEPEKILQAEIFGGPRRPKRSEVALRCVGILPDGYFPVLGRACPLDQYGNVKGSFIVQLISYFQCLWGAGLPRQHDRPAQSRCATKARPSGATPPRWGAVLHQLRQAAIRPNGASAPGIWSAKASTTRNVEPILMFVKAPSYRKRLDFFGKARAGRDRQVQPAFSASACARSKRFHRTGNSNSNA